MSDDAEKQRLDEMQRKGVSWKKWGPYLSERQWGTVREDYSQNGDSWNYFTHDQARSRAYRWGEDGLGGISDDHQRLCFALALWNGNDPILKERAFGLANNEGNHGEDVKEYYFYLDSTPTHSYMKYLYKYPQSAYPYDDIVATNFSRGKHQAEYELLDTGVFDDNRYFDVFVEYAKAAPDDILIRISASNRGPDAAPLRVLPTLWFRAMDRVGERQDEMWDEEDGFFYDVLRFPDGSAMRLKVRSILGLLPLAAVAVFEEDILAKLPKFGERARLFMGRHPEAVANIHLPSTPGIANRRMLSIVDEKKLRRILARMLDEAEFFSPHGVRALSRFHLDHPYVFGHGGQEYRVAYVPGDSDTGMFGGNSNWRGPVWMPVNFLLYTALLRLYAFYGEDFKVECPTGSGQMRTLLQVAQELGERLCRIFLRDPSGGRPVHGEAQKFKDDPHWRDLPLFYEYFHGDTGAGIGASHQTGWTGCIAMILQINAVVTKHLLLTPGAEAAGLRALQVGKIPAKRA